MTYAITYYLDGMIAFGKLTQTEQIWVFVNRREFVPADTMLFYMGQ